jgi:hypothetical protein
MSTADMAAQAGWYAVGGGRERYWDGSAWTHQVRPVPSYVRGEHRDDLLLRLTDFLATPDFTSN